MDIGLHRNLITQELSIGELVAYLTTMRDAIERHYGNVDAVRVRFLCEPKDECNPIVLDTDMHGVRFAYFHDEDDRMLDIVLEAAR